MDGIGSHPEKMSGTAAIGRTKTTDDRVCHSAKLSRQGTFQSLFRFYAYGEQVLEKRCQTVNMPVSSFTPEKMASYSM
jgi:hypothetical protein